MKHLNLATLLVCLIMALCPSAAAAFSNLSPYSYCADSPINLVDPTGDEPTEGEAARMSAYVCGKSVKLVGGWTPSQKDIQNFTPIDKRDHDNSGFKSMLFERTVDGNTEYAYALAGTDVTSLADWENNFLQVVGQSEQYRMALENASALHSELEGFELTFVGYSLGGGMAAACAYSVGGRALTFNPAGVSVFTMKPNPKANIDAYVIYRDELNTLQSISALMPSADGKIHYRLGDATLMGHSIENFYEPSIYQRVYETAKDTLIKVIRIIISK